MLHSWSSSGQTLQRSTWSRRRAAIPRPSPTYGCEDTTWRCGDGTRVLTQRRSFPGCESENMRKSTGTGHQKRLINGTTPQHNYSSLLLSQLLGEECCPERRSLQALGRSLGEGEQAPEVRNSFPKPCKNSWRSAPQLWAPRRESELSQPTWRCCWVLRGWDMQPKRCTRALGTSSSVWSSQAACLGWDRLL